MKPRCRHLSPFVCAVVALVATVTPIVADEAGPRQGQSTWETAKPAADRVSTKATDQKTSSGSGGWPTSGPAEASPARKPDPVTVPVVRKASARPKAAPVKAPAPAAAVAEAVVPPAAKWPAASPAAPDSIEATVLAELHEQRAQIGRLVQLLEQHKTLIDQQRAMLDALQLKAVASHASTVTPAPAPAPAPVPAVAPAPARPPVAAAAPEKKVVPNVDVGFGKMKFNGMLQGWYSAGDSSYINTFRMRRIEIKLSGEVTPKARWTVMIDPAKSLSVNNTYTTVGGVKVLGATSISQSSRLIQDAFVTLDYVKGVQIAMGQFKIPLGLEGLQSSGALDTVERALFMTDKGRNAGYGDARDVGLTLRGKPAPFVEYQVGVFNGLGDSQNDVAKINDKAFVGRLLLRPTFVKGLQLGVSGAWGAVPATPGERRHRKGAEVLWAGRTATVKSEFMTGDDAGVTRGGYYVHLGVKVLPRLELIVRHDVWDPNTKLEQTGAVATERDYIGGFNYYLLQHNVKFQVNFLRKTFAGDLLPSRTLILGNMQTSW